MPTRRRTNRTPPQRGVVKRFPSVNKYLNWVMHSAPAVSKSRREHRQIREEVLCNVTASVLVKAIKENAQISRHFELNSSVPMRKAVKDLLMRENDEEYRLRLSLRQYGNNGTFQMLTGYPHDIPKGQAILTLNQYLTVPEREALQHTMTGCLSGQVISPHKISHWVCPVMIKALEQVNRKIIKGYGVRSIVMPSKDGLSAVIACTKRDGGYSFTTKLNVDIGVWVNTLPRDLKLQHPFPKQHPYPRKGLEMIKGIRDGFEYGDLQVCLHVPLVRKTLLPELQSASLTQLGKRSKTSLTTLDELGPRSQTTIGFNRKFTTIENKSLWTIDYDSIECIIYSHVKQQPSYRPIQEAFKLYNVLVKCGKAKLPQLNERTKTALGLWLFKQSGGKEFSDFIDAFTALLQLTSGCFDHGFCPSFCQPSVNTMSIEDKKEDTKQRLAEDETEHDEDDDAEAEQSNSLAELYTLIHDNDVANTALFIGIY